MIGNLIVIGNICYIKYCITYINCLKMYKCCDKLDVMAFC